MLSIFPALLSYNFAVPLAFRVVVGAAFIAAGWNAAGGDKKRAVNFLSFFKLKDPRWLWVLAAVEIAGGLMLVAGIFTQAVALSFSILLALTLIANRARTESAHGSREILALLLLITLSLLFLGPGFYAFDLPL